MPALRTIVLGMRGTFTAEAFRALVASGCGVSGLVVAGPRGSGWRRLTPMRVLSSEAPTAVDLAWEAGVPVLEVGWVDAAGLRALDALEPDVAAIACFPWLLPRPWRDRPPRGCVNLHPSLLPAYRGPAPLFWQFRAGETRTGVTLHAVDGGADTGSVIAQEPVPFPGGIDTAGAESLTARAGARLLSDWLTGGKTVGPPASAQVASRHPAPDAAARVIPHTWPVRRAYNFIRGAGAWGPFEVETGEGRLTVREAVAMDEAASLGARHRTSGADVLVQFADGVLLAR